MRKKTVSVLGIGEVGSAISRILLKKFTILKIDKEFDEAGFSEVLVLHVCIPYSKTFIKSVVTQAKKNKPKLIIIHSTVKPGTTNIVSRKTSVPTVHSPVMGVHPNLEKHIKKFKKVIGPTDKKSALLAKKHFKEVGIKTVIFNNTLESELGKLLDTTYYGWNIIFNKEVYKLCSKYKISFDNVYTTFNKIYNEGYKNEKPQVIRPILKYESGPVGGHCIIPNAELLEMYEDNILTKSIIKLNKKY